MNPIQHSYLFEISDSFLYSMPGKFWHFKFITYRPPFSSGLINQPSRLLMPLPGAGANALNSKSWRSIHDHEFGQAEPYIPVSWVYFPHMFPWLLPRQFGRAYNSFCLGILLLAWARYFPTQAVLGSNSQRAWGQGQKGSEADALGDRSTTEDVVSTDKAISREFGDSKFSASSMSARMSLSHLSVPPVPHRCPYLSMRDPEGRAFSWHCYLETLTMTSWARPQPCEPSLPIGDEGLFQCAIKLSRLLTHTSHQTPITSSSPFPCTCPPWPSKARRFHASVTKSHSHFISHRPPTTMQYPVLRPMPPSMKT